MSKAEGKGATLAKKERGGGWGREGEVFSSSSFLLSFFLLFFFFVFSWRGVERKGGGCRGVQNEPPRTQFREREMRKRRIGEVLELRPLSEAG